MKKIRKHFDLLINITIADWISLSALAPVICGYYLILNNKPYPAIIAVSIAFLLDTLDGFVARKLKITSDFGKQLDTLVDTLNYLAFTTLFIMLYLNFNNILIITTALIMISAGILRLARYNIVGLIENNNKQYYIGAPVPFAQLAVVILFLATNLISEKIIYLTPVIVIFVSFLMISTIKFRKPKSFIFLLTIIMPILCLALIQMQK